MPSLPQQVIKESLEDMEVVKKMKVKKGCLAVRVGLEDNQEGFRRFMLPISYLYHPLFKALLETAHEVYGYHTTGPLRLPCTVDDFLHLRWLIERESGDSHGHRCQHISRFLLPC